MNMPPIQRAVNIVGSQTALARKLSLSQGRVWQWLNDPSAKVPAERCIAIEQATEGAVTRYELRPDIFGEAPKAAAAIVQLAEREAPSKTEGA
jgi:DNA-binding transcriptional regulator YdaS (Cro superfamily)